MLHYSVLSEDYKHAWTTIIDALIFVVTTNEIKVVRIYLSSIFFRMIYWNRNGLPLQGKMKGFQGKSRVVTGELLDARVISDRLFLSIEDSVSRFLWLLKRIELKKNWRRLSSACWSAKCFYSCNLFCRRSLPSLVHANCDVLTCKPSYNLIHILWLEVSRAHQSRAFLYLTNSFKTANYNANKRGRRISLLHITKFELIKSNKT